MLVNHQVFTEPWGHKGHANEANVMQQSFLPSTGPADIAAADPTTHTTSPIVTGTSVIGLKFKDGVMLAADNLASYGSMARFRNIERLIQVGPHTTVGVGGDISDFQYIERLLDDLTIREQDAADGHVLRPEHVHEYLSRVMYNRRSKQNPLWNSMIVAGTAPVPKSIKTVESNGTQKKSEGAFMAFVDLLGTTYSSPVIATGMGSAMAIPLLRKATDNDAWKTLSREDARHVVDECMKVLFYRDARSLNKFSVATVTLEEGVQFERDQKVDTQWKFAEFQYGYK
jgi:20S proteasome subunit beta 7